MSQSKWVVMLITMFLVQSAWSKSVTVGLVLDGTAEVSMQLKKVFTQELDSLLAGEFEVSYVEFVGSYSTTSIQTAIEQAYANNDVDLVLAADVIGNQLMVRKKNFSKPTFLPLVFGGGLLSPPKDGNSSGKRNLNYLAEDSDFIKEVQGFLDIIPFDNLAIIGDSTIFEAFEDMDQWERNVLQETGVTLHRVPLTGQEDIRALSFDAGVDAVALGGLRQLSVAKQLQLIDRINQLKLPSFGLLGREQVEQGALATSAFDQDWQRLARQIALNIQATLLGEAVADQPIIFNAKKSTIINMATARAIAYSPRFDVLGEATLINEFDVSNSRQYTISEVAYSALQNNLDLLAEQQNIKIAAQDSRAIAANFLPQVTFNSTYRQVKKSPAVLSSALAEKSTDGRIGLSQVIYSDDLSTNKYTAQLLEQSSELGVQDLRLEIIRASTTAYLNVLRVQKQLLIQKENLQLTKTNLDLAKNRVELGSSSAADLYRWESQLSTVRSNLIATQNQLKQTKEALNSLLNRPLDEAFILVEPSRQDLLLFPEEQFNSLIYNQALFDQFSATVLQSGLDESPVLQQLKLQIQIKQRQIKNHQRSYWLPDFALSGEYSDNFDQSGLGTNAGEYQDDWNLVLNASIPLFQGGTRRAALAKAQFEQEQLQLSYQANELKIEQSIKAAFHNTFASYQNIELFERAYEFSKKNLDLVTDSYAKGVVSIIELLDAQNSSIQAQVAASNAVYDFLIEILALERATSRYNFMLTEQEKAARQQQLIQIFEQYTGQYK